MLFVLSDLYFVGSVALIMLIGATLITVIRNKKEQEQVDNYHQEVRKLELQRLVENREERALLEPYPENKFWELIEWTRNRSKKGYTFRLGVLRDYITDLDPDDIVRIDNLYFKLISENITHDVTAASAIIFGSGDISTAVLFMNFMMMEGEVFFKNACHNPNFILGKQIDHLEGRTLEHVLADLYFRKTGKLIPIIPETNQMLQPLGSPWKERDLPSRYPELWQAFA